MFQVLALFIKFILVSNLIKKQQNLERLYLFKKYIFNFVLKIEKKKFVEEKFEGFVVPLFHVS